MQNVRNRQAPAQRLRQHLKKYWRLHVMALPVLICLALFSYAPMLGLVMAFQKVNIGKGILHSPFIGLKNFEFLFKTQDAWVITRNTVCYNLVFITLNTALALILSLILNELLSQRLAKGIQTILIMPHFLSMAVIAMIVSAFMGKQYGLVNAVRQMLGLKAVDWYITRSVWPPLLVFINAWKTVGYSAVVYLATISGISHEYYEAAVLDGASKLQQALYITLPYMRPMISIMLIMAVGNIFRGDFGLFYTVPQNSGMLYPVTNVIDTYIYRALTTLNNPGMATAAGLYQSAVGFVLVLIANKIVTCIDADSAMF